MQKRLGFDVYGTLVNPLDMEMYLKPMVGEQAVPFASLWRQKQLEYSFRRGLMGQYKNFDVCTQQALTYTDMALLTNLTAEQQADLLENYLHLQPFADVRAGLSQLKAQGHQLVAFSNGVEDSLRTLLSNGGILTHLEDVVSVDDVKTFKPNPAVYNYLVERLGDEIEQTWLVSSNGWDIIGAKLTGLKGVWVKRNPQMVFDYSWGIKPDLIVSDFETLAAQFGDA